MNQNSLSPMGPILNISFTFHFPFALAALLDPLGIDHFTVVCSVTWPFNGSEVDTDLTSFVVQNKLF